ncbi:hypothetical protein BD289DRAFT_448430 [Coniella lustricola]|uniref:Uncharacterized protein n=1 Tax=Coniella lustricola TaxID=2025994 RepID=A0A2T2ZS70_9PEZI|nr:hypothetical protein BD289DRAFT_448430 [Coniella lustricola]
MPTTAPPSGIPASRLVISCSATPRRASSARMMASFCFATQYRRRANADTPTVSPPVCTACERPSAIDALAAKCWRSLRISSCCSCAVVRCAVLSVYAGKSSSNVSWRPMAGELVWFWCVCVCVCVLLMLMLMLMLCVCS